MLSHDAKYLLIAVTVIVIMGYLSYLARPYVKDAVTGIVNYLF